MNKKKITIYSILLTTLAVVSFLYVCNVNNIELELIPETFAVFIEQADGSYAPHTGDAWPSGYTLNTSESYCKFGSELIWNDETNSVEILSDGTDECYVYLENSQYFNDYIINLYDGTDGNHDLYYTNNAEYRYAGSNPNNYVMFNDELWRIIGVFGESAHGVSDQNLVKLIKAEELGIYEYDTSGRVNNIDDSQLHSLLNIYYANGLEAQSLTSNCGANGHGSCDFTNSGLNQNSLEMIQSASWSFDTYIESSRTALDYYNKSLVTGTSFYKIGLINPSDYAFASPSNCWNQSTNQYATNGCAEANWLYQGINNEWTTMPYDNYNQSSGVGFKAYAIINNGTLSLSNYDTGNLVRPTIYLKYNVLYGGGDGSVESPFLLKNETLPSDSLTRYLIENHTETEGLYRHINTDEYSAGDYNYRYSGSNPNNFICLLPGNENCPEEYLYRIMGIFDSTGDYKAKLIKSSSAFEYRFDESRIEAEGAHLWEGLSKNDASDDAQVNIYLNTTYLNSIDVSAKELIDPSYFTTGSSLDPYDITPKDLFISSSNYTAQKYYFALINPHEYLYGASKTYWGYMNSNSEDNSRDYYGNQSIKNTNWYSNNMTEGEWTMHIATWGGYSSVFNIEHDQGAVWATTPYYNEKVRPVLFLKKDVLKTSGTGTQSDPFRISL